MFNYTKLHIQALVAGLIDNEKGQTLVEYALIIAFLSVALVAALIALAGGIGNGFTNIENAI